MPVIAARGRRVKPRLMLAMLPLLVWAGQEASAQELSGAYAIFWQSSCQIITSGIATPNRGGASNSVGIAVFSPSPGNPDSGLADIRETVVGGPPISANTGTIVANPRHSTVPYETSATTLMINGNRFNAAYADIRNGVAGHVVFNGVLDDGKFQNACAAIGTLRTVTE